MVASGHWWHEDIVAIIEISRYSASGFSVGQKLAVKQRGIRGCIAGKIEWLPPTHWAIGCDGKKVIVTRFDKPRVVHIV